VLVPVMLRNGTEEIVSSNVLDRMLEEKKVDFFRRSDGWVVVGRDLLRGMGGKIYVGRERRSELIGARH